MKSARERSRRAKRRQQWARSFRSRLRMEALEDRRMLATFAVNSTGFDFDGNLTDGICDTGSNSPDTEPPFITTGICTLTAAAMQADHDSGHDTITFGEIGGSDSPAIDIGRSLAITFPVTIDGTTHASGRVGVLGSLAIMDDSTIKGIAISGHSTDLTIGGTGNLVTDTYVGFDPSGTGGATDDSGRLNLRGNNNTIGSSDPDARNLIAGGLFIEGNENLVIGNYVGTDLTGTEQAPGSSSVFVVGDHNHIGTGEADEGNLLAGGIIVDGKQVFIRGNKIGTKADGDSSIDPSGTTGAVGVSVRPGAEDVEIGGEEEGQGNLISAMHIGVFIGGKNVRVWGNQIGTNLAGDAGLPNAEAGIRVGNPIAPSTPENIQIGGVFPELGNQISGNPRGISLERISPTDLLIANNHIGTNKDGTAAVPNEVGISVGNSEKIVIGGEDGNLISGNDTGIVLGGPLTKEVVVAGNRIGTNAAGTGRLGNTTGIFVINGANNNLIGGRLPSQPSGPVLGNVISGSEADFPRSLWGVGVWIIGSNNNVVQGNRIGTNLDGTAGIGNDGEGILVYQSQGTQIGGTQTGEGNLISGNGDGVLLWSEDASQPVKDTQIVGNLIGTDAAGTSAIGNKSWGVHLTGHVRENHIGGDQPQSRNVISGNDLDGILLFSENTTLNTIHGNYIGLNQDGNAAVANLHSGIRVDQAPNNAIGFRANATFQRNVISGNLDNGITVVGDGASMNTIEANIIGLSADGKTAVPNAKNGVLVEDSSDNTIGGEVANDRNVISGNSMYGLELRGPTTENNLVFQNYIGLNLDGDDVIGNMLSGVLIDGAPRNTIGKIDGTSPLRNYIGGNREHGIVISGSDATENVVHGNYIGLGPDGSARLGNLKSGVAIESAPANLIGSYNSPSMQASSPISPAGNFISHNRENGIWIQGSDATGNQVFGNAIGTDSRGAYDSNNAFFGNAENGVRIDGAPSNFIGSFSPEGGFTIGFPTQAIPSTRSLPAKLPPNVIVDSGLDGIRVTGNTATGNRLLSNVLHHNVSQGIDLGPIAVTDNDEEALDADTGPNSLQNYPDNLDFLTSANDPNLTITASFTSQPNKQYLIQTFGNTRGDTTGQGERLVDSRIITTGPDGKRQFSVQIPKPAAGSNGELAATYFSMTATNEQGETSEFSPTATAADLVVRPFEISLNKIAWQGNKLIWSDAIFVCNDGGREANDVKLAFLNNFGDPISPGNATATTLDFPAGPNSCHRIPLEWDLTSQMKTFLGKGPIGLEIDVDVDDTIRELNEDNTFTVSRELDIRPKIETVETEFKPGHFVRGVSVTNEVWVETVDWNGQLPGKMDTGTVEKKLLFAAGVARDSEIITSSFPHTFEFDIGEQLPVGRNEIRVEAQTFPEFERGVWTQNTNVIDVPAWLANFILNKKEEGEWGKRVALYSQKIGFPGFVTEGFFDIPASEIKIAKGELGPTIGEYELAFEYRSDGDGTLTGKAPWSGKIGGRQVLPEGNVAISGTVNPFNNKIFAKKLQGTWSVSGELETPRIRLAPPFSMFEVFAYLEGGAAVTFGVEQTDEGKLDWQSVQIGITGGAVGMIGSGYKQLVSVSGGVGARMTPTFNLSGHPCILDTLTAQMILRAEVTALGFEARYDVNIPDPAYQVAGCGGQAGGEGQGGLLGEGAGPSIALAPHTGGTWYASLRPDGLPDIRYEFAAPSIAHHADGTKTLIWVDEDPAKATHERLEILSSRYINGSWQAPIIVTDDSLLDQQPTISALADGRALAVWSRASDALDAITPSPYSNLASYNLVYALFDPVSGQWSAPRVIEDATGLDYLPNLSSSASGATLAYFNDADGSTSLFPDDGNSISNTLLFRTFDASNNTWSSASTIANDVDSSAVPQVIIGDFGSGVDGMAVWNENVNGLSCGQRQRVAVARSLAWETTPLLADEPTSGLPATTADPLGGQLLAWVQSEVSKSSDPNDIVDQLWISRLVDGAFTTPSMLHEASAIGEPVFSVDSSDRVHLTWSETTRAQVNVHSISRDTDAMWGKANAVSTSGDMPWWLMPWVEQDELKVLHLNREVFRVPADNGSEGETADEIGSLLQLRNPSLALSSTPLGPDLTVEDIWMTDQDGNLVTGGQPGQEVTVNVVVQNIGDFSAGANAISLAYQGSALAANESVGSLNPGTNSTHQFSITLPNSAATAFTMEARVDAGEVVSERDESNNSMQFTALKPDLSIGSVTTELVDGKVAVRAVVENIGTAPTTAQTPVVLRVDHLISGDPIPVTGGIPSVPPLEPGQQFVIQFDIDNPNQVLGGPRTGFLIVDPATTDSTDLNPNPHGDGNTDNNYAIASLRPNLTWQNVDLVYDVNGDGEISPIDALVVINDINRFGARALPAVPTPPPFLDVSGDQFVSALDVLLVINELNRNSQGEAESAALSHDLALETELDLDDLLLPGSSVAIDFSDQLKRQKTRGL